MTRRDTSRSRYARPLAGVLALAVAASLGSPLVAQTTDHSTMDHSTMPMPGDDATAAYQKAMDSMMTGMMIPYSGNPDVDFIRGMIPHHQGAVDNARIVLQYGKDPEVLKFAQGVIDAQEAEIKWMTEWLAKNGG